MFDWLRDLFGWINENFGALVAWVEGFVIGVPLYVAAPAMIIVGALDSSLLSLPEINDYLVVMRCAKDPSAVFYFPLFAAAGSVLGCLLLYTIIRRGGQAVLRRRFRTTDIERVERAYARFGFLALAVPALLPPPMPFKIFVATAGALEYPRWRFMTTIMLARSLRYVVMGALGVFYGEQVLEFFKSYGGTVLGIVGAIAVTAIVVIYVKNRRSRREEAARAAEAPVRAETETAELVVTPEKEV